MSKQLFPKILLIFIIMFSVANAVADHFFLYWMIPWLDMLMHFLGGTWIGFTVLWIYYLSGKLKSIPDNHRSISHVYLLAGTVALAIGVLWEIFEFSLVFFITFNKFNGFYDTASDILFALIGATISAKYFINKEYYKEQKSDLNN